jgi:ABC-type transport system substrate-binding protein
MATRYEASDLAPKRVGGGPTRETKRAFNAALALIDGSGKVRPYVAEALPELNAPSWVVHPDVVQFRPQFERETNVIQDVWGRLGIEMDIQILPTVQLRVNESRTTFPDLYDTVTGAREDQLYIFSEAHIAMAARNWAGDNRGGWANGDFERWWGAFNSTLDRSQRNQHVVEAMKVVTDQLPGIMLYFNPRPLAYLAGLRGPEIQSPEALINWNIHEWELR